MKLVVLLALLAIVVSLGTALVRLTREGGSSSKGTLRALAWRIGLSLALFAFIMLAIRMGWVTPHGVGG
jgi:TRAP-type C4-dicarboxylate transport system permease large subunit